MCQVSLKDKQQQIDLYNINVKAKSCLLSSTLITSVIQMTGYDSIISTWK